MGDCDNENILHGPPLLQEIPQGSYGLTIYRCLQQHYNLPLAFIDAKTRNNISYKTIFEKSLQLAYSLQQRGITQNDVIAISSENNILCVLPLIAGLYIGASVTLFNPQYTPREVLHVADISKPNVIFCSEISLQPILNNRHKMKYLKMVNAIESDSQRTDVESIESFIAANRLSYKHFEPVNVDGQKVALIMYSSGTTGLPKGVMLTHYNLNTAFVFFSDERLFLKNCPGTTTSLGLVPFFHVFGVTLFFISIQYGNTLLLISKFEPHVFLKSVEDFKIKSLPIVPPIASFLTNSKMVDEYDLSHVRIISSGGAPLKKHIQDLLLKRFKNVPNIRQGYGLTEATIAATFAPIGKEKPGSTGKVLPGTSAKVVHVETGSILGPGKKGELYLKGPHIMKGYAGDTASTNVAIDENGWLRTGDIGYYDADGYVYIIDRLKELIKYKGFQVAPAELEALLLEHPKIEDAAVIGIPDDIAGEVPLAVVVKKQNESLTESDVTTYVAGQVAPYKHLRGGVRFVTEIPKTASGKILRRELRQLICQKSKL